MQNDPFTRKILVSFEVNDYVDVPHDATEAEAVELGEAFMKETVAKTGLYHDATTLDVTELDL